MAELALLEMAPFSKIERISADPLDLRRKFGSSNYSNEFQDFLGHCLEKDKSKRFKVKQLLEHSWMMNIQQTIQSIHHLLLDLSKSSIRHSYLSKSFDPLSVFSPSSSAGDTSTSEKAKIDVGDILNDFKQNNSCEITNKFVSFVENVINQQDITMLTIKDLDLLSTDRNYINAFCTTVSRIVDALNMEELYIESTL